MISKKADKLWLWKAVSYPDGKLLDWEIGGRDEKTFRRLFDRIEARFSPQIYCADTWAVYNKVIPAERLSQGKAGTHTVESHNSNTRHWFARFKRKSKAVSQSAQMVDLTLKLHAFRNEIF